MLKHRSLFKTWWYLTLLLLPALACNAFAGRPSNLLPPPPTRAPVGEGGATTPGPVLAPTATLPGDSELTVNGTVRILIDLNIRRGPGVSFEQLGVLNRGEVVPVVGRDSASGWWRVVCPVGISSPECWVSGGSRYTQFEPQPSPTP